MQDFSRPRIEMVERLALEYPDADPRVLDAMELIPRHLFSERGFWHMAYGDCSLPIGHGQTLSQPATVLRALSSLSLSETDILLEIGSGSGYLAAVASRLCRKVYGMERILALVHSTRRRLGELSIYSVQIGFGDGSDGWPEHGPYNAVLFSACATTLSDAIGRQLCPGGCVAAPVGRGENQEFRLWIREGDVLKPAEILFSCSFVPLVAGEGGRNRHG